MYEHRKIEFVTVNQNALYYDGGKMVFHRSVVKACFVFRNPHCPILKTALHRLQLRIMSGPVGIRLQLVMSGRTELFLSGAPLADKKFSNRKFLYIQLTQMSHVQTLVKCRYKRKSYKIDRGLVSDMLLTFKIRKKFGNFSKTKLYFKRFCVWGFLSNAYLK